MKSQGLYVIIVLIYVISVMVKAASQNKNGKKKGASSPAAKNGAGRPAAAPGKSFEARPVPTLHLGRKHSDDDCEYGEVNHQYSHTSEKRVRQLDGYLAAGLIDKKEYRQMLERYSRMEEQFKDF